MKSKLIMSGLAALGVMAGTSGAYADDAARDAMAQRLAPVGQLCLQGQECGTAAAPEAASNGGDTIDGAGIYNRVCMACHETGAAGAPVRGDEAAWSERIEQGFATLLEHSINGIGAMPARGGNPNLSDEEMEASTAYLLEPVMEVPEQGGSDAADDAVAEETTAEEGTADEAASEDVAAAEEAADEAAAASEEDVASAGNGFDGEALYGTAGCAACHNNGVAGAPVLGDADAWAERLDKGIDELYANSIGGIGAMPPKGGNMRLEDEEVMAIVDYMVAEVE